MKRQNYRKTLPREMYTFFSSYDDTASAPSFQKFARLIGVTTEQLEEFRVHRGFDKAYRECLEIRRDYLIDRALCKRFDPSFIKFLISEDCEVEDSEIAVRLEVVE